MDTQSVVVGLLVGLGAGALVAWLLLRARQGVLSTQLEERSRSAEEKLAAYRDVEGRLKDAMAGLARDALHQNNEAFLTLAEQRFLTLNETANGELKAKKQEIDGLLSPIRTALDRVDTALTDFDRKRIGDQSKLLTEIDTLRKANQDLQTQTGKLVTALRQPQVRGQWGEFQLKRVIELAGMQEHCDFVEQESTTSDNGRLRPDVIVKLAGGKQLIIDAKCPLSALLDAAEADDEQERTRKLRDHVRQVRDHIVKLGSKAYWDQFDDTPDLVIMFLPGESFFSAALQGDPNLIESGLDSRVILASPLTLIALLRSVAHGWRQEKIAENARTISTLGKELYDRLASFGEHMGSLGHALERASNAYNASIGTLENRVLVSARRFKDLGATVSEEIETLNPQEISLRRLAAPEFAGSETSEELVQQP